MAEAPKIKKDTRGGIVRTGLGAFMTYATVAGTNAIKIILENPITAQMTSRETVSYALGSAAVGTFTLFSGLMAY